MYKLSLLALALAFALGACSDGDKLPAGGNRDGGGERPDAGNTVQDGAGDEAADLERAPGNLPRPPGNKLPADLKPPGYAK